MKKLIFATHNANKVKEVRNQLMGTYEILGLNDIGFYEEIIEDKKTIIERIEKRKILEKRSDDDSATILKRHDTYMQTTKPVLEHYNKNSNFYEIDGGLKIEEITGKIEDIINV